MKKYSICFFLFLLVSAVCLAAGYFITRDQARQKEAATHKTIESETITEEVTVIMTEPDAKEAANKNRIQKEQAEQYYLVSDSGFLLVMSKDQSTICLYTHIPVTDFPEKERERLLEGIWFPAMADVFSYLESHTS